jgi:nicotinamide-nucleotide amidase
MKATVTSEIIAVGDEILRGEVEEHNSSFLSRAMARIGLVPARVTVVPDDLGVLTEEIREATVRSDIVVVTGGLGPTVDDVTREAAIVALGGRTEERDDILKQVEARFRRLGRAMPAAYRDQARVPAGADVLPNTAGAAVGLRIAGDDCELFLLPGVPEEMREMFTRSVLPLISGRGTDTTCRLRTFGLTETELEEKLGELFGGGVSSRMSIISGPSGVDLYVPAGAGDVMTVDDIRSALGSRCYADRDETLEEVLVGLLVKRRKTVVSAESVTGGLLASTIVSVPGASDILLEGFVTYSNGSKTERLGVDSALIGEFGAVSEEVCVAMARGARERSGADFALSTTGIAGPGGGSVQKPVGLCYVGLATAGMCYRRRFLFPGTRQLVRQRTVYHALDMLRLHVIGAKEMLLPYVVENDTDRRRP